MIFVWGAVIYFKERTPPRGATEVYVVAKQWMWKLQHEEGQREINELHVPVGRDVKMIMTSQDVIHSFYVPAFRIKQDVLPGRYTTAWFHPTKAGTYHLFCAEYCGIAALGHDRPGRGDGAGAVSGLAQRRRRVGIDGVERPESFSATGLLHLPPLRYAGPRSQSGRAVRQAGATGRRARGHGRRKLHSRIHSDARRENRQRIQTHHAGVSGTGERRATERAGGIREIIEPEPIGSGGRSDGSSVGREAAGTKGAIAMATAAITAERENYLNQEYGIKSWLLTVDHKRIALLYLLSITFFFFIGGFFALLIRLELLTPAGDLVQADTYNKLFTMHGQVMVFFFLIPSIPAVLGNFLVPLMIGAKDLAFPRINLLSWYLYIIAGILMLHCMLTGGVDTGWTFYTPFSTAFSNTKVIEAGLAIFIAGFSSILTGLNFVVTIHRMRAPGMTWNRLPLFIWAHYATSIIQLLGTPVIAVTLVLVVLERAFHLGIFDPTRGGDPLLFQHLFWFYSHPAVYIMILARHGRGQRDHALLLAQAHFRLQVRRPVEYRHCGLRIPGLGAPHVRGRHFALFRADLFLLSATWLRCLRPSRSSTGPPPCTRARSRSPRPCCTPSASSACSPWAA